jgi:uncharacterized Tic20 family protein
MAAHLSALGLYLGLLFVNLLLPYLIWRRHRDRHRFAADHALAALNFQITASLAGLAALSIAFILPLAWLAVIAVFTANIVYIGQSADRARSGRPCRYPLCIPWFR